MLSRLTVLGAILARTGRGAVPGLLMASLLLPACAGPAAGVSQGNAPPPAASTTSSGQPSPLVGEPSPATACTGRSTPAQTEGPFFKAGSPQRTSLVEPGMAGTRLVLTGRVLTLNCVPVAGAKLDFWQADASGTYDNSGYRLRGHQFTDAQGRYSLETIVPGQYPGRTVHVHLKATPPGGQALITQLYFPGVARNQQDSIFNPALLVSVRDTGDGKSATFDLVLNLR